MNTTPCITLDAETIAAIKSVLRSEDRLPGESVTDQVKRFALGSIRVFLAELAG
ncbi:MAG: hypothetical protein K8R57_08655 [Verrucomicrobia bacterium]|nr:hypothetical protein [Verrucomicrobiota bacterium]